jgi:hypothetical protein
MPRTALRTTSSGRSVIIVVEGVDLHPRHVASVPKVRLLDPLLTGELYAGAVHDHHMVTVIR